MVAAAPRVAAILRVAAAPAVPGVTGAAAAAGVPGVTAAAGAAGAAAAAAAAVAPAGVAGLVGGGLAAGLGQLLHAVVAGLVAGLALPLAHYVLHTPDLLAEPTLWTLWRTMVAVGLAVAVPALAVAGVAAAAGWQPAPAGVSRELLRALLLGLPTAALALPLVAGEARLANLLVDAVLPAGAVPAERALVRSVATPAGATAGGGPPGGPALVLVAAVGAVLLAGLVVAGLIRWSLLWLLVALAPLAMAVALLPAGGWAGRLWWRLQLAAVLLPVAQAVLLAAYAAMLAAPHTGLVGALAGVAVLLLATRLPGWALGVATHPHAGEVAGRLRSAALLAGRGAPRPPVPGSRPAVGR